MGRSAWWWVFVLGGCTTEASENLPTGVDLPEWKPLAPVVAAPGAGAMSVSAPWDGGVSVTVALRAWGAEGALVDADPVLPSEQPCPTVGCVSRTAFVRDGVVEWWERGPAGLHHGFTLPNPPRDRLVFELSLDGATASIDADGRSASWSSAEGGLRYEGLQAWDARGVDLPARLEATDAGLRLVVDARGSVGEITVDPIVPGASWQDSGVGGSGFGNAVTNAGDVNGDGWDDVVVTASWYDNLQNNEGAIYLYLGSAGGLGANPVWSQEGNQSWSGFGDELLGDVDVNGDGYDDLVVGAYLWLAGGAVFVYHGSPTGLGATWDWWFNGEMVGAPGTLAASDVDGDGYDDLIRYSTAHPNPDGSNDALVVHFGSPSGLGPSGPALYAGLPEGFGSALAGGFDLEGDGYEDLAVGAQQFGEGQLEEGAVFLLRGSAAGLSPVPSWFYQSNRPSVLFGSTVAAAGDVNGDGYPDLAVASKAEEVHLFLGSATGFGSEPVWTDRPELEYSDFGAAMSSAGDLNGDGFGDLVVGAPEAEVGAGRVHVYLGSEAILQRAGTIWTGAIGDNLGTAVSGGGDVNGDGYDDFIVGAPWHDGLGPQQGGVFVYHGGFVPDGDGDGIVDLSDVCPTLADPLQVDTDLDGIGNACDAPNVSADAVGLGRMTLIATGALPGETVHFAGAPGPGGVGPCPPPLGGVCFDLGLGALSLGTGLADAAGTAAVTVPLPGPGGAYTIQAAIVRGSSGSRSVVSRPTSVAGADLDYDVDGLSDAFEDTIATDPTLADTDGDGLLDGEELEPHLDPLVPDSDGDGVEDGLDRCVAGDDAVDGDVDGVPDRCDACAVEPDPAQADSDRDGLGDVCEGNPWSAPIWSADGAAGGNRFGIPARGRGDVNGDGYEEVLLGEPKFDGGAEDQGRVRLYSGTPTGPTSIASWSEEGGTRFALFGEHTAFAGDVNGDGYDDLLVGAPEWEDFNLLEIGQARLYHGGPGGPREVWTYAPSQSWAWFGSDVSGAGDVNGDGYDDVVIGANGLGRVYVFHGSSTGLRGLPDWIWDGGSTSDFGRQVVGLGDVNGDGYDDIAVGGSNGQRNQVFYGSSTGLASRPDASLPGSNVMASAGDVNGDGYADLIVGRYQAEGQVNQEGEAQVFLGSANGLRSPPAWSVGSGQEYGGLGSAVASAGDTNGDGYDDVLVGIADWDGGLTDEGAVWLYLGSATGPARRPAATVEGGAANADLGLWLGGSGDHDGDGFDDALVVAPGLSGQRGTAFVMRGSRP